jgi:hypothetical protein
VIYSWGLNLYISCVPKVVTSSNWGLNPTPIYIKIYERESKPRWPLSRHGWRSSIWSRLWFWIMCHRCQLLCTRNICYLYFLPVISSYLTFIFDPCGIVKVEGCCGPMVPRGQPPCIRNVFYLEYLLSVIFRASLLFQILPFNLTLLTLRNDGGCGYNM